LATPVAGLFFGPAIWRFASGQRPILEHGLLVFIMEGFVELLESTSSYISNTVSFLRVGAFALSHAVLSFIVFTLSDMVASQAPGGAVFAISNVRQHHEDQTREHKKLNNEWSEQNESENAATAAQITK
jgi:V/A-type H+-transporting ATPase subunit I